MNDSRPVALITMASGYVGPAMARSLAARGFDIALQGTDDADSMVGVEVPLGQQVTDLEALGASVLTITDVDLSTADGNRSLVAQTIDRFGRLDSACLVTGPDRGRQVPRHDHRPVGTGQADEPRHGVPRAPGRAATDGRGRQRPSGRVHVGDRARPDPITSIYGGTRAGANGIVRAVGLEYARAGIQVNAVGTNYMDFPGFLKASRADTDPERRAAIEAQVPMRKLGTMEELAAFTTVLLDGTSRFQTGQFFSFSGGWST